MFLSYFKVLYFFSYLKNPISQKVELGQKSFQNFGKKCKSTFVPMALGIMTVKTILHLDQRWLSCLKMQPNLCVYLHKSLMEDTVAIFGATETFFGSDIISGKRRIQR